MPDPGRVPVVRPRTAPAEGARILDLHPAAETLVAAWLRGIKRRPFDISSPPRKIEIKSFDQSARGAGPVTNVLLASHDAGHGQNAFPGTPAQGFGMLVSWGSGIITVPVCFGYLARLDGTGQRANPVAQTSWLVSAGSLLLPGRPQGCPSTLALSMLAGAEVSRPPRSTLP